MTASTDDTELPVAIGTAGHVDHGKTTLIRALTGVDTDRLVEEKRRGMTIDLGFAPFRLPDGRLAGVVDVPGHERFLKNMLAGASGLDLVVLVVAADDGVMPQTREHLAILEALQVRRGLVALTKADTVDAELLELAVEDVREALAGSFLADAPVLPVSATTGAGLDALRMAIADLASATPRRDAAGPVRLPIDRVFTKQGFGTVVTGTLASGTLREGDTVAIAPAGLTGRVRGLQVHGAARPFAVAGQRVAVNLAGCDRAELERGEWLLTPDALAASTLLDVQLELAPDAAPLAHRTRIRLHHGTAERIGRVVLLDRAELAPGETAPAQLVLERPVVAAYGDRFVLRRYAPIGFLGGGRVLHASPAKHKRHHPGALAALEALGAGDPLAAMAEALKQAQRTPVALDTLLGYVPADRHDEAKAWLNAHATATDATHYMGAEAAHALMSDLERSLSQFHAAVPWRLGLSKEAIAQRTKLPLPIVARMLSAMAAAGAIATVGRLYALGGHQPVDPPAVARLRAGVAEVLAAQPLADLEDFAALGGGDALAPLLEDLIEAGAVVRLAGGIYAAAPRLEAIRDRLRAHFETTPELTASVARELVGASRKYVIPLLEHLDAEGFTRRRGDVRTLAPRREA